MNKYTANLGPQWRSPQQWGAIGAEIKKAVRGNVASMTKRQSDDGSHIVTVAADAMPSGCSGLFAWNKDRA